MHKLHIKPFSMVTLSLTGVLALHAVAAQSIAPAFKAKDPGVRTGYTSSGEPIAGLTSNQLLYFDIGKEVFSESESVADGLGPTLNLDSCGGCHSHPTVGGSAPAVNPQVAVAKKLGASNAIPSFITANGPVRVARFIRNADGSSDGGVHALFTIAGRSDAPGCQLAQPDFATQLAYKNITFRIPTPVYGLGLIEQIPDSVIVANAATNAARKGALGIRGRPNFVLSGNSISGQPNRNGNDGTIARFGWKAQNKSLLLFSGEAYNVEMGISNELFQTERDETESCQFTTLPNSVTSTEELEPSQAISSIEKFSFFMRFLAPPESSTTTPGGATSISRGKDLFSNVGCALCHTPTLQTGNHATVAALGNKSANLYSDLLIHEMGSGLADGVSQGQAGPGEFRTAPLWGLGQRIFFLHDGRTSDLLTAIQAHKSGGPFGSSGLFSPAPSEANGVINLFNSLTEPQKQDVLNFLRSL